LRGVALRTPLERTAWLSELAGCDVYLKLECWQRTRSFKIRGAYNAAARLSKEFTERGLVTASAGNHGQGVALAGKLLGVRTTVFVPESAPRTKREAIAGLRAHVREVTGDYDDAAVAARRFAAETGAHLLHPFVGGDVVAGQGTIAAEIVDALPRVRDVLIPVGGGGLVGGMGLYLKEVSDGAIRVVGVQSERTPAMHAAFAAGRVVDAPSGATLADGLAGEVEEESYRLALQVTDDLVLVSETLIAAAIRGLYVKERVVAEGAGAVGVAALLAGGLELRGPAVVVVSGGNIDASLLAELLAGC